jgi:uncharacterized protein YecT (DUF1311 family)
MFFLSSYLSTELSKIYMTKIILASIFCISASICFGQTQSDMNESAENGYQKADKELNRVYHQILNEYKDDTAFIRNFKNAQRLWVLFRDAEMNAKFPESPDHYYGSVLPMCWSMELTGLTQERTQKLKVWIDGIEEGDACSGSVKMKKAN